jgi:hypothetical protein
MGWRSKLLWALVSVALFVLGATGIYVGYQKVMSLPFRAANDYLHQRNAPITLDFLIPGGIYIDEKMTIREVARIRFAQPKDRVEQAIRHLSEMVPLKYRLLAAAVFYLFWVLLFLAFLRVFTWARYTTALAASFFFGALVYFFMPDLVVGRWDDVGFLAWSLAFGGALFWYRRQRG